MSPTVGVHGELPSSPALKRALDRGDTDAFAALYASNAWLMPSSSPVVGRDTIRPFVAAMFESGVKSWEMNSGNVIMAGNYVVDPRRRAANDRELHDDVSDNGAKAESKPHRHLQSDRCAGSNHSPHENLHLNLVRWPQCETNLALKVGLTRDGDPR